MCGRDDPCNLRLSGPLHRRCAAVPLPHKRRRKYIASALALLIATPCLAAGWDNKLLNDSVTKAGALPRLHALIVARDGVPVVERVFRGPSLDTAVDIKSESKTIIDALTGIAIDRGLLASPDSPMLPLLVKRTPPGVDPRLGGITLDHLLSMRAGLERTSGRQNYGRWVNSPDWISFVLTRPFYDRPGGMMLYSTGNTHLLSAILTDASGKSTLELAREWLGAPLHIAIPAWTRDPQGVYFGGNEMSLSPRALLRFGEMFRNRGTYDGVRIVPQNWIAASWTPRTHDRHNDGYGYGWFISEAHGHAIYYAWGFGGQMLYVIPSLALTIVVMSDSTAPFIETDYHCALQTLVADGFIPAAIGHAPERADSIAADHGCHVLPGFPP
jgi:CubicO group peptidase (beta-lactamase class C family)